MRPAPSRPQEFPTDASQYTLLEECGRGASATVWKAHCKPLDEVVAIKLLDLERMNCSMDEIVREAQTMRQQHHPNVLPLHCCFVHQHHLWMVMPYIAGGSVLNIMKYAFPQGLEEPVIATILKEVLKGLDYLHRHGCIHRDVKAGNILVESNGQVRLADFGVAATMERGGSWGNQQVARSTFVGTPCWMAPEVMEQVQGYNSLADIWSFGITILELAHGHAPFAKLPPMKVLLMTLQNPPPTLETESTRKHFSKAMRDIVTKCLVKDPQKRPTAAQLLEHKFFKTSHEAGYLVKHLLAGLPPVTERVRLMQAGKAPSDGLEQEAAAVSQEAYVRGVSSWNFDVDAFKSSMPSRTVTDSSEAGAPALPTVIEGQPALAAALGAAGAVASLPPGPTIASAQLPPLAHPAPGSGAATPIGASSSSGSALPAHVASIASHGSAPMLGAHADSGGAADRMHLERSSADRMPMDRASVPPLPEGTEKAKRKGRFQIVEDDYTAAPVTRSVSRSTSASATEGAAATAPTSPALATASLLPVLRSMARHIQTQYEVMKDLVEAVQATEDGRRTPVPALLHGIQDRLTAHLPRSDDHALLAAETSRLREENAALRRQMAELQLAASHHRPPGS